MFFDLDHDNWFMQDEQTISRLLSFMNIINELKVKMTYYGRANDLWHSFNKGLSKTDSLAAQEWSIRHMMSLFSTWGQVIPAVGVKSFWNVLLRLNPLVFVPVKMVHVNHKLITCLDCVLTYLACLGQCANWRIHNRWFNSQGFWETVTIVSKLKDVVIVKDLSKFKFF